MTLSGIVHREGHIQVGPFQLDAVIGSGGMGDVWSARHVEQKKRVAIKLLTSHAARDPDFWLAFRNEVRSVAFLDHPRIVSIYDYGEVLPDEATDAIPAGTPWLAMELVEGDTLLQRCGQIDWPQLLLVCSGLLDALAHAHARGVYHRDLKPANVLVGRRERINDVKLMDFGLAHAAEGTEADHFNGGTPAYMAPEQFDGRWRNYGPWTDLYGLGCLIYAVITGSPPFGPSRTFDASRELHKSGTVPPLESPFPLPAGFESWLRRLLEKDPARRYRRAADALHDLLSMRPPARVPLRPMSGKDASADTVRLHTLSTFIRAGDLPPGEVAFTVGSTMADPPPLPRDWRGSQRADRSLRTGLNLFGIRKVPLVGRESERDQLWEALHRARSTRSVQVVALHGPTGVGVSRLAEWLGHRAHEVGSAILMRAAHSAIAGPHDGLGGMAYRFLRCDGLNAIRLRERVRALVGENREEGEALLELLAPGTAAVRFGSRSERHYAVEQLLIRATQERPVVMWMNDVQWGEDSLQFVERLLRRGLDRPVLILLTAADDALAERTAERVLWEGIVARPSTRALAVQPLGPEHRAQLVQEVVGLEPKLARRVETATKGNPQFLIRLLEDWVDAGQLAPGPDGYVLESEAHIPPNLETLLEERVERVLGRYGRADAQALELAATLGREVVNDEWQAVCTHLGVEPSDILLPDLLDAGLALRGTGGFGWSFSHHHLPQYLQRRAALHGRLERYHEAVATILAPDATKPAVAARIGAHLLGARAPQEALEPLMLAIRKGTKAGDYASTSNLLDQYDRALDLAKLPASDVRRGQSMFERHLLLVPQGQLEEADQVLNELVRRAQRFGWHRLQVKAGIAAGRRYRVAGQQERAQAILEQALSDAEAIGAEVLAARARRELGDLFIDAGMIDDGRTLVRQALKGFEAHDKLTGQAKCWQSLGEATKEAGDHEEAAMLLSKAADLFDQAGNRWGKGSALNSLGDTLRHMGRLEDSVDLYRQAAGVFRAIGSPAVIYPQYNAALSNLAIGDNLTAEPTIQHALREFMRLENAVAEGSAQLALGICAAQRGDWEAWDSRFRTFMMTRRKVSMLDEDTGWMCEVAGACAREAGQGYRALQAYRLALEIWVALDRPSRIQHARTIVGELTEESQRA